MTKKIFLTFIFVLISSQLAADESFLAMSAFKSELIEQSGGSLSWAEKVPGVMTHLDTKDNVIAITLNACGTPGDGYDDRVVGYLKRGRIPATIFVSGLWIDKNPEGFREIASVPEFEIANHGDKHKPCSVNGKAACGAVGTSGRDEIIAELERNADKIAKVTGYKPKYYRSGFAFYDPQGARIAQELGYKIVDGVLGDRVGFYSTEDIKTKIVSAEPGTIIMAHMNHPERKEAEIVIAAIEELKSKGFRFVKLSDYNLN